MSLKKILAVAVFALAATGVAALPAAAKQPKKIKAPFALEQIDRNGDRNISNKEWDWAEKHGYDRLTRKGGDVTRKQYQAQVNAYYHYVDWRRGRYDDEDGPRWGWNGNGYDNDHGNLNHGAPWELGHR